jgi:hypothetical protein
MDRASAMGRYGSMIVIDVTVAPARGARRASPVGA